MDCGCNDIGAPSPWIPRSRGEDQSLAPAHTLAVPHGAGIFLLYAVAAVAPIAAAFAPIAAASIPIAAAAAPFVLPGSSHSWRFPRILESDSAWVPQLSQVPFQETLGVVANSSVAERTLVRSLAPFLGAFLHGLSEASVRRLPLRAGLTGALGSRGWFY